VPFRDLPWKIWIDPLKKNMGEAIGSFWDLPSCVLKTSKIPLRGEATGYQMSGKANTTPEKCTDLYSK
jgi:hypothetical protein